MGIKLQHGYYMFNVLLFGVLLFAWPKSNQKVKKVRFSTQATRLARTFQLAHAALNGGAALGEGDGKVVFDAMFFPFLIDK